MPASRPASPRPLRRCDSAPAAPGPPPPPRPPAWPAQVVPYDAAAVRRRFAAAVAAPPGPSPGPAPAPPGSGPQEPGRASAAAVGGADGGPLPPAQAAARRPGPASAAAAAGAAAAPDRRPRVLIFSSDAGAGHVVAAGAIRAALGEGYRVSEVKPFDFDLTVPALGPCRGVDVYNQVQAHGPPLLLDVMGGFQRLVAPLGDVLHGERVEQLLAAHDPDLVVSVVPMGHGTLFRAARARRTPMLVVPTDLQFGHFADQIEAPAPHFRLALPFAALRTEAPQLPEAAFAVTGYPVRPEFAAAHGRDAVAAALALAPLSVGAADRLVMVMMGGGGVGGERVRANAERLAGGLAGALGDAAPPPTVHVVAVCGRNVELRRSLAPLARRTARAAVRVHALGQCDAATVAALMRRASVLITKPGGATVNEALAVDLPLLFDAHVHAPLWEVPNATFAVSRQLGAWAAADDLVPQVAATLRRPRPHGPCPARDFARRLRALTREMLAHSDKAVLP